MACIASPELRPGAASPQMFMDGKPLNRSSFGEPLVQRPVENAENGTILPLLPQTYSRSRSFGSIR